jgi:hypothetical protein
VLDRDNDGFLSRFEIKQVLINKEYTDLDLIDDILDELDENGEGKI